MSPQEPLLLIVDPSVVAPEPESVPRVAGDWPGPVRVLLPALDAGSPLPTADRDTAAALVVLGSQASVHDPLPWLSGDGTDGGGEGARGSGGLAAWLRAVIEAPSPTPVLGTCFGHQLLAHLAGGRVGFVHADRRKEEGVRHVRLTDFSLLPGEDRAAVIASHREHVVAAPPSWRVTGQRPGVPVDAMEHDSKPLFGVQFHPDAGPRFLADRGHDAALAGPDVMGAADRLLAAFRRLALARWRGRLSGPPGCAPPSSPAGRP